MTDLQDTKTKNYPSSLHKYTLYYQDGSIRILYANGSTHAIAVSKENWPNDIVKDIEIMDDSWKN